MKRPKPDIPSDLRGRMVWEHKTGPMLELLTEEQLKQDGSRARVYSGARDKNKFLSDTAFEGTPRPEGESVNVSQARCHPTEPAVGPSRLCVACALAWYAKRLPSQ